MDTFIFWEDHDGDHHAVPISSIKELFYVPAKPETDALEAEEASLTIYADGENFEVEGKAAQRAWDEIKLQIANAGLKKE